MIPPRKPAISQSELKALLARKDSAFWSELANSTRQSVAFSELIFFSTLRKRALAQSLDSAPELVTLRVALLGGYSLYPLKELVEQKLWATGFGLQWFKGDFDNYASEILEGGALRQFKPELIILLPSASRCQYAGKLSDPIEAIRAAATEAMDGLLDLCRRAHEYTGAEVILANFIPPSRHDLGGYRNRTLASGWSFRRQVNLGLGLQAPPYVHLCDLEFLAARRGLLASIDDRSWYESKQLCGPDLLVDVAAELTHQVSSLRFAPKKVLVLDLDNTVWGGVIGDDGLDGIEIGDTSPRGEAFKAFQRYARSLKERGVLLAVASKNDHDKATEPFEKHPEMVLRLDDIVSFKANWNPKSDNIRAMSSELNLGLDSFVFVDDNPAEIEIVRQFVPEVTTIHLGADPSEFIALLEDSRLFEVRALTSEDAARTDQYLQEYRRRAHSEQVTDMDSYLRSLEMTGAIKAFGPIDIPRIAQLINKSNQFNLTTRRRTEAEVEAVMRSPAHECFSIRLADRFGDHGLIAVIVTEVIDDTLEIDTWLMSCRVLKRQVEEEVVNEIHRLAKSRGCRRILGRYLPTAKNEMVRELYPRMGFSALAVTVKDPGECRYESLILGRQPVPTHIQITRA